MDDDELEKNIAGISVFARIEPLLKLRIVRAFKARGHVVAMTGDGVNDAPALEAADIGVAMGITGTDVAKEASDMVLTDDNFRTILAAVEEGRAIFNRLRNVVLFLLATCLGELLALILSVAFTGKAPLVPLQIIWVNLVTGTLMAIPLGMEPQSGDELRQPPRHPKVGLIYPGLLARLGIFSTLLGVSVFLVFLFALDGMPLEAARTVAFCCMVVFEWFIAFSVRSDTRSLFRLGVFTNRALVYALLAAVGLQLAVIYIPVLRGLMGAVALTLPQWGLALLPGLSIFILENLRMLLAPKLFDAGKWQPRNSRTRFS